MLVVFQKGNKVTNKAFAVLVTIINLTNETIARKENAFTLRAINKNWEGFRVATTANSDNLTISKFWQSSSNKRVIDSAAIAMPLANVLFGTKILKLRCTYQTKKDMEGNSKQDKHFNRTSWSLSNVTVQSQIGEQENVFPKKPSCTVQRFLLFH